jgi:hypothetical protein
MKSKKIFLILALSGLLATGCSTAATNSSENGANASSDGTVAESVTSSPVEEVGSVGLTYTLKGDNTYWVSSFGSCQDAEIIIPSIYQGKAVTGIAQEAFAYTETITSVYIPASVQKIQANAFLLCMNLEKVTFETTIGWTVRTSDFLIDGETVDVADTAQAATLLKATYVNYYWVLS